MPVMKPILQAESAECGLACLAMVAAFHGRHVGLAELRRDCALSLRGIRLEQLILAAEDLGFEARALRLDVEDLHRLRMPCVLHWDFSHFVVLARADKRGVTLLDPAVGERRLSYREVSASFTGVALELSPASGFEPRASAPSIGIGQLTGKVRGFWGGIGQVVALSLVLQLFVILAPFYLQWVVDHALVSADSNLLTVLGIGFCLALVLQVLVGALRAWSVVYLSSFLGLQWMGNVFAHLVKLPLDFFEKRHLGDVTSRMESVHVIQRTMTTSFLEALIDGLMAIVTLVLMLIYSWKLALITLLAVVVYFSIRMAAFRSMRDRTERQLVAAARQQTYLLETLRGMQSLKVAGQGAFRKVAYNNLLTETVNQDIRLAQMNLGFVSANQLIFGLERVAVIWLGAVLALQNVFSVGMLVAYLAYKDQFATRVGTLIDRLVEFRMLRLHGERLADIVLAPPEDDLRPGRAAEIPVEIEVEFRDVWFRYSSNEPWILENCSFKVQPGESVAIIGPSGCGKTTLIKLMLGLLSPDRGEIRIGGQEIRKLGALRLSTVVGAVMQEDQLFGGSIADNICFFDPQFDQARIEHAARLAGVAQEVEEMPMAYHSLIGDMGSSLSGGQKQRVILARALYRNPRLLVLDEATSHLDVEKERIVNEAVRKLELTKVIVAHRPETIASADRILEVKAGRIVAGEAMQCLSRTG